MQMVAAMLMPTGGIRLEALVVPTPGPGEALIRVLCCGVCTSDMRVYQTGLGDPTVLGHEVVGIVEALCDGAGSLSVGQRVTGAIMKGYAEYACTPIANLIPVPEALQDFEAIVEPYSCMMSGIRRAGCKGAESANVIGAGYMGLAMIALLKDAGVQRVNVADMSASALDRARALGADAVYAPGQALPESGFVFEAAGAQGALTMASECVARDGTLTIVGYHPCSRQIDMNQWAGKAITVINAFEYHKDIQLQNMRQALELASLGVLPQKQLFTHSFPLDQVDQAFQTHLNRPDGFIKAYVNIVNR